MGASDKRHAFGSSIRRRRSTIRSIAASACSALTEGGMATVRFSLTHPGKSHMDRRWSGQVAHALRAALSVRSDREERLKRT
ncbi:hypothetical protein GCM10023175_53550 [Pseudonocardia xishanensis]|uniref:Uncharacterized protein n=1 Tax=Pseudonocardia xishanensis TaxID=630995 RepID=A0ABP8RYL2_9PSEU